MPNWCQNNLSVHGDDAEVQKFLSELGEFCFEKVSPCPEDLKGTCKGFLAGMDGVDARIVNGKYVPIPKEETETLIQKYGCGNERDWFINNWGTKWDIDPTEFYPIPDGCSAGFETAWTPPSELVKALSAKYPALTFTLDYLEPGESFAGQEVFSAGEMIKSVCMNMDDLNEVASISENHSLWVEAFED